MSLISRNGTDVGVQLSSMPGRWFIADSPPVSDALLREGYEESDKAKDIGDSAVIECIGLGGMAVGAAPAVAAFFGGDAADAIARTERMREICAGALDALHDPVDGLRADAGRHRRAARLRARDRAADHDRRAARLRRRRPDRRRRRAPADRAVPGRDDRARGRARRGVVRPR